MTTTHPTPSAPSVSDETQDATSWRQHRRTALALKVAAFVVPVVASLAWSIVLARLLSTPTALGGHIIWWIIVAGGAFLVALLVERIARRLLPMAMLLHLALVFPDTAPSRFTMALRSNSTRQLKRRIEEGVVDENSTPQEAAVALLELSASLSVHDRMTRGHAERVRAYSVMIGEQLELEEDDLQKLHWSALLHDVGKLDVSSAILNKPGRPDDEELKSLRAHPARGGEYITPLEDWLGEWTLAASQHHERHDGEGYPLQLAGDEISLSARIVSVADAYDVMTSTRSYKTAMDPQKARAELLNCSGSQFDPEIVRAFLSVPISELRRPFQAAMGAGALASLTQLVDFRTLATGTTAVLGAVAASAVGGQEPPPQPPAIAFVEDVPAQVELIEDSPLEIPLDTTTEADTFTLDSVDGPATASISEQVLTIVPNDNESGAVTVVLTACSEDSCDTKTITANVIAVNDPPSAVADSAETTALEASISIPVLENDTDVENADLFVQSTELSQGDGDVLIVGGGRELLFTPAPGSVGPWTIEYVVTDGVDGFDRGEVTITDGDLAPTATDDIATVRAGEVVVIDVRSNDTDDGGNDNLNVVSAVIVDPVDSSSTVEVSADANIVFTAGPQASVVIVEYVVSDQRLRESTARVAVTVTALAPDAVDDEATTPEDTPVTVSVLDNDGPAELDLSTASMRIVSQSSGTVDLSNGEITYTPPANAVGQASVIYELCSTADLCDQARLLITVTPVQDVSPFAAEGQIVLPASAGPQLIPWTIVSSGNSSIRPGTTFTISTDQPGLFASPPAISSAGVLTFTPQSGASGTAESTVTVRDSAGQRQYLLEIIVR